MLWSSCTLHPRHRIGVNEHTVPKRVLLVRSFTDKAKLFVKLDSWDVIGVNRKFQTGQVEPKVSQLYCRPH